MCKGEPCTLRVCTLRVCTPRACTPRACTLHGLRLSTLARPHICPELVSTCGPSMSPTEEYLESGHALGTFSPCHPQRNLYPGEVLGFPHRWYGHSLAQGHLPSPQGPSLHPGTGWLAFVHFSLDRVLHLGVSHMPQGHRLLSALPTGACQVTV